MADQGQLYRGGLFGYVAQAETYLGWLYFLAEKGACQACNIPQYLQNKFPLLSQTQINTVMNTAGDSRRAADALAGKVPDKPFDWAMAPVSLGLPAGVKARVDAVAQGPAADGSGQAYSKFHIDFADFESAAKMLEKIEKEAKKEKEERDFTKGESFLKDDFEEYWAEKSLIVGVRKADDEVPF